MHIYTYFAKFQSNFVPTPPSRAIGFGRRSSTNEAAPFPTALTTSIMKIMFSPFKKNVSVFNTYAYMLWWRYGGVTLRESRSEERQRGACCCFLSIRVNVGRLKIAYSAKGAETAYTLDGVVELR